ncbi:PAS/PAC sensor signal transduction histidine kinase [Desulforamulus reducens MI-1]|uniref:histidine kinase n=1 Tax=Desulforamulus reducens (strain ATCC BAA-1160 / DSM 100696 / MI-1) TaxID=349161 RepID=A4J3M0_DESRM|nr:ATP-binding protein [Desulforamulus reducens]ABO49673.1 PAS/PAC sensor signal transduction histidine kinase [Desulforamulus reducens MI-1]
MIDRLISVPHLNQLVLYSIWEKFINGQRIETKDLFSETYKAWLRCVEYRINPYQITTESLSEEELSYRKSKLTDMLELLTPHIETIKTTLSTHSDTFLILITDHEGFILESFTGKDSTKDLINVPYAPGIGYAEHLAGNNGIGSVLATGIPLAVLGAEHFVKDFHRWSCVGSPIIGDKGDIIAVLGVFMPCGMESPYTFSLTVAATKAVEAAIKQGQMEKQLQDTRKTLRNLMQQRNIIFNAMSQGVIILNHEGIVTFFNKAAEEIWHINADELVGRPFFCFSRCRRAEPLLIRSLKEANSFTNIECKCSNLLHEKYILVNISLLRDEKNAVSGAIGIYTDVTELRRQEARIREQEKLAVVGQMAAGMAHEIRNPLTSVRGFAQLMSEKMAEEQNPYKEFMEIMIQEIDQADSFINNFLQLARPKPPKMQACSLNQLILNFIKIFESQAFLQGVKIGIDLGEIPTIVIDKDQIKQVLLNLCQNALQAMNMQGTITIATRFHAAEKEVSLSVRDNGPGIPGDNIDKLGTPFFTTKDKGTGLGLSISYTIVDKHQGRIEVESTIDEGTCFKVYLPVYEQF